MMQRIGAVMANSEDLKARIARLAANAQTSGVTRDGGCTACDDTGFVMFDAGRGSAAYACVCPAGQRRPAHVKTIREVADAQALRELFPDGLPMATIGNAIRLEACGVGRGESRYTFETFVQRFQGDKAAERHLAVARLWVETEPQKRSDLVLFGSHGRGKTGLAIAIARALVDAKAQRETVHFTEAETIAARIRGTYRGGGDDGRYDPGDRHESERDIVQELTTVGTLIIDEVTGVKMTEFVDDKLRLIVATRQKNLKPTILTLNVDASLSADASGIEAALARIVGPALYDRLAERAQFFAMFGPSTRGQQRRSGTR